MPLRCRYNFCPPAIALSRIQRGLRPAHRFSEIDVTIPKSTMVQLFYSILCISSVYCFL